MAVLPVSRSPMMSSRWPRPSGSIEAAYVNYLGEVDEEGIRAAYGKKYERLAALKEKYDPTNFFCTNQNIKPSGSARTAAAD